MRSRRPSRFIAAATTSSATPATRFPPTQSGSKPAPKTPSRKYRTAKTSPTRPSAARSEDVIACLLAPAHRFDGGLGEHEEARDHHREVGQVLGVDEPLHEI